MTHGLYFRMTIFMGLAALLSAAVKAQPTLIEQGDRLFKRGAYAEAAELWERTLATETRPGHRSELRLRLSEAYQIGGHLEPAADHAEAALNSARTPAQRLRALARRIDVHLAGQQSTEAGELMVDELLPLAEQIENADLQSLAWNTKGNVSRLGGKYAEALSAYQKAAAWATDNNNEPERIQALNNAADTAWLSGQTEAAREFLRRAWQGLQKLQPGHSRLREALAQVRLALEISRERPETLLLAREILDFSREELSLTEDATLRAYWHGYLGRVYERAGHYREAFRLTHQAWFHAQQDDGIAYLWLWQRGRILQAQGKIDAAADSYRAALDLLQPIRNALLNGRRQAGRSFREAVRPVYYALVDVVLRQSAAAENEAEAQARLEEARQVLEAMKLAELQDYFRDECVAALSRRESLPENLPPRVAVLYPVLLPDRVELLAQVGERLHRRTVEKSAAEVDALAVELRQKLEIRSKQTFMLQSWELYRILLHPLDELFQRENIETLVFVPDGALRLIPPAALHDGQHYLVENRAVVVTPGLNMTDTQAPADGQIRALLGGLSESVQGFEELKNTAREIERIRGLYLQPTTLFNQDFLLSRLAQNLGASPYRVVHMASHGEFKRDPEKSFILTYDSRLTMNQLTELLRQSGYQAGGVELLTLSACQTAAGDERAALGLGGVAVRAGARGALASLWYVNDQATSELVMEFYHQLQNNHATKAEALRRAQRELIADPLFKHPAYWAPFLLIGNWR